MNITIAEWLIYIFWNLFVFFLYGLDKRRAQRNLWRISERTLLLTAFAGGGFGALAGMYYFRHKTRHLKFQILVPLFCVMKIGMLILLIS